MKNGATCAGIALSLLLAAMPAWAQKDPATRLLEEQREQALQRSLEPEPPMRLAVPPRPALDARPADVAESGPTIAHPAITVDAAGLLAPDVVESTIAPFAALALGENRLELLLRQLDARLVEAGYVTSHAVLESASIDSGMVRIFIRPGRIEDMRSGGRPLEPGVARAFPLARGDVLRLTDVEQGIHQINRLRLYQAQVNIRSGESPGSSVLDLVLGTGTSWRASFGADNQGSAATGQNRVRAAFAVDDALGMLDALQLQALVSSRSRALFASLAVPRGYDTWSLTASASRSRQRLPGDLDLRSESWTALAGWNRVLTLSAEGRDAIDVSFARSRFERRIEGAALATEHLGVLRAALSHVRRAPGVQWYAEPALSAGVPLFGARRDGDDLDRGDAHAQFVKLAINAGVVGTAGARAVELALQAGGQASRVSLYAAEQLSLGGMTTVRGFREGVLAGDSGYLLRGEMRLARAFVGVPLAERATPYVHLDHGAARLVQADRRELTSTGVGLRWAQRGAVLETVASYPLDGPAAAREGWRLHFSLGLEI